MKKKWQNFAQNTVPSIVSFFSRAIVSPVGGKRKSRIRSIDNGPQNRSPVVLVGFSNVLYRWKGSMGAAETPVEIGQTRRDAWDTSASPSPFLREVGEKSRRSDRPHSVLGSSLPDPRPALPRSKKNGP